MTASYLYDYAGRLVSMERGGERYFYHANARGDVLALTDRSGQIVNSYAYDPYGRVLEASETVVNLYRYAGYRFDEGTGLYYLWNRYYDPASMRFITKDLYPGELTSPGTMNGYAYCLGDPVNAVDPTGLLAARDFWLTPPSPDAWAVAGIGTGLDVASLVLLLTFPPAAPFTTVTGALVDFTYTTSYLVPRALGRLPCESKASWGDVAFGYLGAMPGVSTVQLIAYGLGSYIESTTERGVFTRYEE